MGRAQETCWTVIDGAAAGRADDRRRFAETYAPVVRAYLGARWRGSQQAQEIEDAAQEVFIACFREGGVLDAVDRERGGFRPFLFATVRNVARQFETRRKRRREQRLDTGMARGVHDPDEVTLASAFDRAWALAIVEKARSDQHAAAEAAGEDAVRRAELLRLRFDEGRPIRDIAKEWDADPAKLHREFAKARREFHSALVEVVLFHHPGTRAQAGDEARKLLELLAS